MDLAEKELLLDLSEEAQKNSVVFPGEQPLWRLTFSNGAALESIPEILLKTDSTEEVFLHGFCKMALFKISENFLWYIFAIIFSTKLRACNLYVTIYWKWRVRQKYIEVIYNVKGDLDCVKKRCLYLNADANEEMLTPRCQFRDFQMTTRTHFDKFYIQ